MDPNLADVARVVQANIRPGAAGVRALVDPVAVGDVDADRSLTCTDVDDIGICWSDGEGADRGSGEETVGNRAPVDAAVDGFPDAARARAEIKRIWIVVATCD